MSLLRERINLGPEDLVKLAKELLQQLRRPACIFLEGELGVGKTTLVQEIMASFGEDDVPSPSYSLVNDYGTILHADFYRLKDASELRELDLSELLEGKDLVFVEWGHQYLSELRTYFPTHFFFYLLKISDSGPNARNYALYESADTGTNFPTIS